MAPHKYEIFYRYEQQKPEDKKWLYKSLDKVLD